MKKDNSRKEEKQREIVGIDLGDKVSHYAVINEEGEVVEEGTFRNQTTSIDKHFRGQPRRIALEVGAQSAWISRQLQQLGHEVIVANARQVRWITASDQKSDRMDAKKLAWLARADVRLLAPVEHRNAEQQAELSLIRARDAAVRARTLLVNAARGIAKSFGQRLPATVTATFGKRALALLGRAENFLLTRTAVSWKSPGWQADLPFGGGCLPLCCPALLAACGNHSGEAEHHSGIGLKLFGFIPEAVFTFTPESCSRSSRNTVRNHTGIAFTLPRIPQLERAA
jgi:hypothetical protein